MKNLKFLIWTLALAMPMTFVSCEPADDSLDKLKSQYATGDYDDDDDYDDKDDDDNSEKLPSEKDPDDDTAADVLKFMYTGEAEVTEGMLRGATQYDTPITIYMDQSKKTITLSFDAISFPDGSSRSIEYPDVKYFENAGTISAAASGVTTSDVKNGSVTMTITDEKASVNINASYDGYSIKFKTK